MSNGLKHLVFDMGGVLVQLDWQGQIAQLLGDQIAPDQLHQAWANSKSVAAYERRQCDFDTFAKKMIEEYNLKLSLEECQACFRNIIGPDFPGVIELLQALKPNYNLCLLSNTNPVHWQMIQHRNSFLPLIDQPFTSMDFGVMKPDLLIYEKLIDALDCEAEEILFFDDGEKNIAAAEQLGICAEQVFGVSDIRKVLPKYGIRY